MYAIEKNVQMHKTMLHVDGRNKKTKGCLCEP